MNSIAHPNASLSTALGQATSMDDHAASSRSTSSSSSTVEMLQVSTTLTEPSILDITDPSILMPARELVLAGWNGIDQASFTPVAHNTNILQGYNVTFRVEEFSTIQRVVQALLAQQFLSSLSTTSSPSQAATQPRTASNDDDNDVSTSTGETDASSNSLTADMPQLSTTVTERSILDMTDLQSTQRGLSQDAMRDLNEVSLCMIAHHLVSAGWNGEDESEFRLQGIREPIVKGYGISFKFSDFQKIKLQVKELLLSTGAN